MEKRKSQRVTSYCCYTTVTEARQYMHDWEGAWLDAVAAAAGWTVACGVQQRLACRRQLQ